MTIVRQSLKDRMGSAPAPSTSSGSRLASLGGRPARQESASSSSRNEGGGSRGQELLSAPGSGYVQGPLHHLCPRSPESSRRYTDLSSKMYSDTILQSDPKAFIQTLAEERAEAERNRQRASAWSKNGGQSQSQSQPRSRLQNGRNGTGVGSLAARLGGAGGGSGGGSYRGRGTASGMMVD